MFSVLPSPSCPSESRAEPSRASGCYLPGAGTGSGPVGEWASGGLAGALRPAGRGAALTVPPRPQVFHCMSIAILAFFMIEVFFKIFVFRLEFFHHKFEILDSVVVVVSFVLDIVLLFREHEFEALGLLILLRLWRVARIINGTSPGSRAAEQRGGWAGPGWAQRPRARVSISVSSPCLWGSVKRSDLASLRLCG